MKTIGAYKLKRIHLLWMASTIATASNAASLGLDAATSVCDPAGRVHGRPRLTVADASLFPTIPRANTNIPAVVAGERIAQFLLGDPQG